MKKYCYSISEIYSEKDLNEKFDLISIVKDPLNSLKKYFNSIGIYNISDTDQITIRANKNNKYSKLPLFSSKYYDKEDLLSSKIVLNQEDSKIKFFEGEIFENINFSNTEYNEFIEKYNYTGNIDRDVVSCIHFRAEELNLEKYKKYQNMEKMSIKDNENVKKILEMQKEKCIEKKELYLYKTKNIFTLYYNAPYIFDSKTKTFTSDDINKVINTLNSLIMLNRESEEDRFLYYVIAALRQYIIKIESKKGYVPEPIINAETLWIFEDSIVSINENSDIYLKIKIISDNPIEIIEQKQKLLLKK